jgi:hypothetical protein
MAAGEAAGVDMSETVRTGSESESAGPASRRAFLGFALGSAASSVAVAAPLKESRADEPIATPPGTMEVKFGDTFGVLIRLDFRDQAEIAPSGQDILYWLPISLKDEEVGGYQRKRHEVIIEPGRDPPLVPRRLQAHELNNPTHVPQITPESTIEALQKLPTYLGVKQALAGYFVNELRPEFRSGKIAPIVEWGLLYDFSP